MEYLIMLIRHFYKILICFLAAFALQCSVSQAQFTRGTQMNFGKNRVQYIDFLWTFNRFKTFDTYNYLGGQELAQYTGRVAEAEIEEIEKLFDYRINGRFQFMIYNKLSDLKQSNIGLDGDEQTNNTGGLTKIIGSKILLYFDGDYRHFREQIRAGVAQVMVNQLMYGGSIKDRLQSAVLLNLPEWYIQGLISYISKGWSIEDDNRMRDAIMSNKFRKFNNLTGTEAIFAGHSLWNYIVETYGSTSVSNLLYMTRINRNIESGFIYVIGSNTKSLTQNWLLYYQRNYLDDDKNRLAPLGKPIVTIKKNNRTVNQLKVSPDGSQVAYVTNDIGKYKVWIYNTRTNKKKKVSKGGYKSINQATDNSYPVLAWHPSGKYLAAIKEKKGKIWLDYYTLGKKVKKETNKFFYFEKVLDFSFSSSGGEMVMSAVLKGQSDIFTFNPRTKISKQLTKDRWDDATPKFVLNDKYIIFSSNRSEDSLKPTYLRQKAGLETPKKSDIFLYDYLNRSSKLVRITNSPFVNETAPTSIDTSHFSYLSDENGIVNNYIATLDSTIAYIDTVIHYRYIVNSKPNSNLQRNILEHDVNAKRTRYAQLYRYAGKYQLYLNPISISDSSQNSSLKKTGLRQKMDRVALPPLKQKKSDPTFTLLDENKKNPIKENNALPGDSGKIDINNYIFQTDYPTKKNRKQPTAPATTNVTATKSLDTRSEVDSTLQTQKAETPDSIFYQFPKQRNYEIAFNAGYLLTQLDNALINETYQTYTGGAVYFDPGLNGLFKIGLNDLFDDYKIVGGVRLSGNLNSNEYYVSFENLKGRIDKQLSFYRQAREEVNNISYFRIHTHELKYTLRYPFNDLTSLRGSASYRNDRRVNLTTDAFNLIQKNKYENWATLRGEFVFDNTINTGLNLYNGVRYKIFAEHFQQVDEQKTDLSVIGADFRYYQKIHRQIIWANRFAASTSFGQSKLIYYLGSTDNTFVPTDNFNTEIQVDPKQDYAFQALATNMRGFIQNIRNGNSFAVINSEIRFPIFQYLVNKPIRSDFFRNFQVIGFGDIGTAWTGPSPYGKNNALFKREYNGNPISIEVTKKVEPIVGGYGFGIRSRLLGYFLRADWAWGVDDGAVQERIFYFSLGLDF
jgi:Tol biopolymer transport system component